MYTPEMYASSLSTIASRREHRAPVRPGLFMWGCVHEDRSVAERWAAEALSTTYAQDFSRLVSKYAFVGTPDDVFTRFAEFADAGVDTLLCSFACPESEVTATHDLFTAEVLPRVQCRTTRRRVRKYINLFSHEHPGVRERLGRGELAPRPHTGRAASVAEGFEPRRRPRSRPCSAAMG